MRRVTAVVAGASGIKALLLLLSMVAALEVRQHARVVLWLSGTGFFQRPTSTVLKLFKVEVSFIPFCSYINRTMLFHMWSVSIFFFLCINLCGDVFWYRVDPHPQVAAAAAASV